MIWPALSAAVSVPPATMTLAVLLADTDKTPELAERPVEPDDPAIAVTKSAIDSLRDALLSLASTMAIESADTSTAAALSPLISILPPPEASAHTASPLLSMVRT